VGTAISDLSAFAPSWKRIVLARTDRSLRRSYTRRLPGTSEAVGCLLPPEQKKGGLSSVVHEVPSSLSQVATEMPQRRLSDPPDNP